MFRRDTRGEQVMTRTCTILAASAAAAALAFGPSATAHPDHEQKEVREIKIVHADGTKHISKSEFVADCGKGRKFESSATAGEGSKEKRVARMVICSDPGESDEAWAKTLRDALAKVEASDDLPADGKARIAADLRSEIAKLDQ